MSSIQSLELQLPTIVELELSDALHQSFQQRRHQNLPAQRLRSYAGCQDHALAEEVIGLFDRLAGVKPDADPDRRPRRTASQSSWSVAPSTWSGSLSIRLWMRSVGTGSGLPR